MSDKAKRAVELVQEGFLFCCASCKHLQRADDAVDEGCGRTSCGTPMSGTGVIMPEYDGPVSDDHWPQICFVCGMESAAAISFVEQDRVLGICSDHLEGVDSIVDDSLEYLILKRD